MVWLPQFKERGIGTPQVGVSRYFGKVIQVVQVLICSYIVLCKQIYVHFLC